MTKLSSLKFLLFCFGLFSLTFGLQAQNIPIDQNSLVITCNGFFVDSGQGSGNHSVGITQTITICSDSPAPNSHIRLVFQQFDIDGIMTVYNDDNADDPNDIIRVYDPTANGTFPIVTATATNVGGCLTIVFEGNGPAPGWSGAVSCEQACQPIESALFFTDPEIMPVDTGYIDVCLGDTVTLVGGGIYEEDGEIYDQDDATSTIRWNFTDGFEVPNATTVQRVFTEPGGYIFNITITDVIGCVSTNQLRQRIRVAPRPTFNLQTDFVDEVCANDTIVLAGSTEVNPNPNSEVFVDQDTVGFPVSLAFADTTFLPDDGNGAYATSLEFTNFNPGATLTSLDDLIGICLNMEHSYAGDLDIFIECPNGSTATFIDFNGPGLGGQYLGDPIDVDADLSPGIGFDYCFVPDPALLSISEHAIQIGTDPDNSIPGGDYNAITDAEWNNLLGCPLNGDWTINVRDNLFSDNGYIFSWSIEFASYLYPNAENFLVGIEDSYWVQQPNMIFYATDSIEALASFAGINSYSYEVVDSFGCVYDTTLNVTVNPFSDPNCYSCQTILDTTEQSATLCPGSDLQTTLASANTLDTLIQWGAFPYDSFTNARYPTLGLSFNSTIPVNNIRPLNIVDATTNIASICVNIETENTGDIRLFVQSPGGSLFELSTGNGTGANYENTCFTPDAITPIESAASPFTGNFLPETDFSFLNGQPINGDWTIRAWDINGGTTYGEFISWSITFRHENTINYTWTPDDGNLSCTDCPNPIITGGIDQVYTLVATDDYGCSEMGTVTIMEGSLPQDITVSVTDPECGVTVGSATVNLDPAAGFGYAWSHGPTTRIVNNLDPGMYSVTVSAGTCEEVLDITVVGSPFINASVTSVDPVSCNGGSDGQINVESSGGTGVLTYAWDDPNLQVLEDAVFLEAGTYTLIITDENGCMDTLSATVPEPDALAVSFTTDNVDCNGGDDGSANVEVTGGNGGYTYDWDNGAETPSITNVTAGNYTVTITDVEGCQIVDSISVNEPAAAVSLSIVQDVMGCADASLNVATVSAVGGLPPYDYLWSSGATTPTADNLPAGTNSVIVTDGSGCSTMIELEVMDLAPITFNLFSTNPTCNGNADGAMGVNQLTGGAGSVDTDYTFNWSSGSTDIVANNLAGGVEYSLTVTDAQGCSAVQTRFLNEPAPLELTTNQNSVSCFGFDDGTISIVSITGPNPGAYNIQWDAAAGSSQDSVVSGLGAGTYSVAITDVEGCVANRTVSLTEPTALEVSLDKDDVTCFGDLDGQITATVAGGTPGYTYNWSNGNDGPLLTNLSGGAYELQLTDANGCEETRQITIEQPPEIIASAVAEDVICNGDATGRVFVTGGGGRPPFTYGLDGTGFSQRSEFIGLPANDYNVFIRDSGGCIGTTQVTVEDGPEFIADLGVDTLIVFGDSIDLNPQLTGSVGDVLYLWRGSYDGTLLCAGDSLGRAFTTVVSCPSPNAKPEYEIDYLLTAIDSNGCEAEDRLRVRVQKVRVVEVPTAFTPNDDGENDLLLVHGRPGTTVKRFSVFDRWGELIFQDVDFPVNDPDRGWDGNYKSEPVTGGVFLWQVEAEYEDGSTELLTGQTSLLR